jgi:hypothetical protein
MIELTRKPRVHAALCWNCERLLSRTERADGVCGLCADAPAIASICVEAIVSWWVSKAHNEDAHSRLSVPILTA